MKDRIKQIRKEAQMNQEEFGRKIGAKQSTVTAYECGNRVPLDVAINSICREFNINENWLRYGTGEMHPPKTRGEEIGEIVKAAAQSDPDEACKFFHCLIDDMTDGEILLMYEIFKKHFKK